MPRNKKLRDEEIKIPEITVIELDPPADTNSVEARKRAGRRKPPFEMLKSDTPPWRKKPDSGAKRKKSIAEGQESVAAPKPRTKKTNALSAAEIAATVEAKPLSYISDTVSEPVNKEHKRTKPANAASRTKKINKAESNDMQEIDTVNVTATAETPAPKKRGRKPKPRDTGMTGALESTNAEYLEGERISADTDFSVGAEKKESSAVNSDFAEADGSAKMKILFAASEAGPFIRSGGLGDVAASLPKALKKNGNDVRVILPLYQEINWELKRELKYVGAVYVPLGWRRQYCGVFEAKVDGVIYYLIDNEYYFKRNGIYGHFDDAERFAFFSKAILEAMSITGFYPDIVHVNDWQTALTPLFLDVFYRFGRYSEIKTVFTIHNIEFQGKYGINVGEDVVGLDKNAIRLAEYDKCFNFMKASIECANAVTTVSETYAEEILDPFYSYGLEGILKSRRYKLSGIVNGIDTDAYDPTTDRGLFKNFGIDSVELKKENKRNLLDMVGLPYDERRPLIGMVTRLTSQKGLDLVARVADEILGRNVSMIILGKGDWKYETMLKDYENAYPNKMKAIIGFSQDAASKIYAGSDFLLMPSKFEPCGLSQMIAMRYGTVPIVREAGGLKDTVEAYNHVTGTGNGFTFKSYNAYDMLDAVNRAIDTYYNGQELKKVLTNAMSCDFSWERSAVKYENLYRSLL